jgi:hypothetical protein
MSTWSYRPIAARVFGVTSSRIIWPVNGPTQPAFFSLGYYFLRAVDFPADRAALEFPTALRLFDAHDDFPTRIVPTTIRGLADAPCVESLGVPNR